jgi:CBS domain-containing protein
MADAKVRRLPVLDRDRQLVGIVALGDIARNFKDKPTGQALEEISEPGPPG